MHLDTGILHEQDEVGDMKTSQARFKPPRPCYLLSAHLCMLSFKSQYRRAALGRLCDRLPEDHQEEEPVPVLPEVGMCRTNVKQNVLVLKGSKEGRLEPLEQRQRNFLRDRSFEIDFKA